VTELKSTLQGMIFDIILQEQLQASLGEFKTGLLQMLPMHLLQREKYWHISVTRHGLD
jgi:hypothetical protein